MNFLFVASKDIKILIRDKAAVVTLLLMPLMFMTVMSLALAPVFEVGAASASGGSITLPLENLDGGKYSLEVVDLLDSMEGIVLEVGEGDEESLDGALEEVKAGDQAGVLIIPENFSLSIEEGQRTSVRLVIDPAQTNTGSVLEGILRGVFDQVSTEAALSKGVGRVLEPIQEFLPQLPEELRENYTVDRIQEEVSTEARGLRTTPIVTIEREDAGGRQREELPGVYEQNVPGYSVMFAFFILIFVAGSFIGERANGTFRRLMSVPVAGSSIMAGKLLSYYVVVLVQVALLFGVGHLAFGMSLGESVLGMILLTLALGLAATGLGIAVAAFVRTTAQVTGVGILILLTLAALGGCMVPLFIMPEFMQTVSKITPHSWAVTGYQDLIVRGHGISDIYPQLVALLLFAMGFFLIGLFRSRFVRD